MSSNLVRLSEVRDKPGEDEPPTDVEILPRAGDNGKPRRDTELDENGSGGGIDDGLLPPSDIPKPEVVPNDERIGPSLPDINVYQHKKTLAQGMMDLALLSANANQLRYVLESGQKQVYYYVSLVFISLSIILQVAVGIGLIWNSRYNVNKDKQMFAANRVNNLTVIGVFVITVLNVLISAFGVPGTQELAPVQVQDLMSRQDESE